MTTATLVIGDSFINSATLYTGDPQAAYNAATATAIKAVITNKKGNQAYCDEVTLDSGETGADWTNGVVVFNFTPTITAQIANYVSAPERALVELQVETSGGDKLSWTDEIYIKPGNIS